MNQRFQDLLLEYSHLSTPSQEQQGLEQTLWDEFGDEKAVFILDMSGFSLTVQRYGVIHYLSMIRRMQLTVEPIINQYGGRVIKFEADNCFAVLDNVESAIKAGIDINKALKEENEKTPEEFNIHVACGIDYGKILIIDNQDFFGNAVNCACKLGEDLAERGDIYVAQEAFNSVPEGQFDSKVLNLNISGIELTTRSIVF
ncbi:MAG: adenylate/guanylate cyclase domain-containing protein [Lentisphaeraceae bacterium]|nr:adenylate/guanylate cyclase domain-containing protein [Lentisphaeraceae bacterium]